MSDSERLVAEDPRSISPKRTILSGVVCGFMAYAVFAVVALVFAALHPYPADNPHLAKEMWVHRLVFEKIANLVVLGLAGLSLGVLLRQNRGKSVLAASLAAVTYQAAGIVYLVLRWGTGYYVKNHVFVETLALSLVLSCGGAFLGAALGNATRRLRF